MIFSLPLARLGQSMEHAQVHRVCAQPGDAVRPGSALLELRVDLGASGARDCPPVFHYRLVATEKAFVRQLLAAPGALLSVGAPLLLLSRGAEDPLDETPSRPLRCTAIGIQVDLFSGAV